MREIELPGRLVSNPELIEDAIRQSGLTVSKRATLSTCRGSIHWHATKPGSKGTLEITIWPERQRAWIAVHTNREADWIDAAIEQLSARLDASE